MKKAILKDTRKNTLLIATMIALVILLLLMSSYPFFYEKSFVDNYPALALDRASRGAVLIEWTTKKILYDDGASNRTFPASTTKILTALVVLENLELSQKISIPRDAVGVEGSSLYLKEGEVLTVEDLLYGMMLRSGNDAATALALAVSGNLVDFARKMNEKALEIGATSSNFVNPHGLHHKDHYTTAYDLALITAEAMKHPYFCKIIMSQRARIGEDDSFRIIANKNKMLKLYEGANGVKTGFTKNSGRCLVSSAKRNGMQLIAVVLNHGDMWGDSMSILDYGFDNYEMVDVEMLHLYGDYGRKALSEILDDKSMSNLKKYPVPRVALY